MRHVPLVFHAQKLLSISSSDKGNSVSRTIINVTFSFVNFKRQTVEPPDMTNLIAANVPLIPDTWWKRLKYSTKLWQDVVCQSVAV